MSGIDGHLGHVSLSMVQPTIRCCPSCLLTSALRSLSVLSGAEWKEAIDSLSSLTDASVGWHITHSRTDLVRTRMPEQVLQSSDVSTDPCSIFWASRSAQMSLGDLSLVIGTIWSFQPFQWAVNWDSSFL